MTKRYKSKALASIHETAIGLHEAGIMDKRTLKEFDEMCLRTAPRWALAQASRTGTVRFE